MNQNSEEVAQIIKIGTAAMLFGASIVIGLVLYLHGKMVKGNTD